MFSRFDFEGFFFACGSFPRRLMPTQGCRSRNPSLWLCAALAQWGAENPPVLYRLTKPNFIYLLIEPL